MFTKKTYCPPELLVFGSLESSIICQSFTSTESLTNEAFSNTDTIFNW